MNQVLIIEDDASLVVGLSAALEADGHKVVKNQIVLERLLIQRDGAVGMAGNMVESGEHEAIFVIPQRHVHDLVAL